MTITLDLDGDLGSRKQYQKLIPTALFRFKPTNQHLDFADVTAADMSGCQQGLCNLNDLNHDIWPWKLPWIINIISEMDSGGQNYMEKRYYLTF